MIGMEEAVRARRSVRKYSGKAVEADVRKELQNMIDTCNAEAHLKFQLVTNSPGVFDGIMARSFDNVRNYVALVAKKDADPVKIGYYGEKVALEAQRLGMNTCWVGLTYSKRRMDVSIGGDEKNFCVLALGYGAEDPKPHESKPMEKLCTCDGEMPDWFKRGMEWAMLAPTAMNQQKFNFALTGGNKVKATTGRGAYSEVDLGIAKLHFELGAGKENFEWA